MIINKSYKMLSCINWKPVQKKPPKKPLFVQKLKTVYMSLEWSNLEFCSLIWSCNNSKYINDLGIMSNKSFWKGKIAIMILICISLEILLMLLKTPWT